MDKCPKCGGEVKVLTRSLEFWGGMDCVAVENRDSLQQLKAEIAALIPDFLPVLVADEISGNRLHAIVEKLWQLSAV